MRSRMPFPIRMKTGDSQVTLKSTLMTLSMEDLHSYFPHEPL
jgi:hypothetical protein